MAALQGTELCERFAILPRTPETVGFDEIRLQLWRGVDLIGGLRLGVRLDRPCRDTEDPYAEKGDQSANRRDPQRRRSGAPGGRLYGTASVDTKSVCRRRIGRDTERKPESGHARQSSQEEQRECDVHQRGMSLSL